jgi:hypothetical protein
VRERERRNITLKEIFYDGGLGKSKEEKKIE